MGLLAEHLSPMQRAQYARFGYFEVIGGDSGRRYRIRHGQILNVELLDRTERRMCLLCFLPEADLPLGDVMLAQKIALETFEIEAIAIAHRTPVWDDRWGSETRRWGRLRR